MNIEIKSLLNESVLFDFETTSLKLAIEVAVKTDADLMYADLRGANLRGSDLMYVDLTGANLRGANLRGANLKGANLVGANLVGADISDADLTGANLRGANLRGSDLMYVDLTGADLTGANLRVANLGGADLTCANLGGADLTGANLTIIRDDLWAVLSSAPNEVLGLRQAIIDGRIDGSTYQGDCACLVGTLANIRHCRYKDMPTLKPNPDRPAERFFLAIRPGDTPENSQFSQLVLQWIDEWSANNCKSSFVDNLEV